MEKKSMERPTPKRILNLKTEVYNTRQELGQAAGLDAAARMREIIANKGRCVAVFAAAPSQNEFLDTLKVQPGIDWSKVVAFHLDEYVGLPESHSASFRNYLKSHIFDEVKPGVINLIGGDAPDTEAEVARYTELLRNNKIDLAFIGIGENGHLAFNDPPVADFNDKALIKIVDLEERCRVQQVHDGCFPELGNVPKKAFSMTIPELMSADYLFTMVPTKLKAEAVRATITGPITTECPASILRMHPHCTLYLDKDSASLL